MVEHRHLLQLPNIHEAFDLDAVPPHLHCQGHADTHLRCHWYMHSSWHRGLVPSNIPMCTCVGHVDHCEKAHGQVHQSERVGVVVKSPTITAEASNRFYFGNATVNVITDVLIAILPIRAIWQLQIPRKQRITLLCILTLGWL
jgi:hypothetical protein